MYETAAEKAEVRADTPLDRALLGIAEQMDRLSHQVSRMKDRLERAMAPERPVDATPEADIRVVPSMSPLTDQLDTLRRSVRAPIRSTTSLGC